MSEADRTARSPRLDGETDFQWATRCGIEWLIATDHWPFRRVDGGPIDLSTLETLGFKFKEPVDRNFLRCHMPPGWKKVASGEPSEGVIAVLDLNERCRFLLVYNPAPVPTAYMMEAD